MIVIIDSYQFLINQAGKGVLYHTITFDANKGSPTPKPLRVKNGTFWRDVKDRVATPVLEGHTLKGWRLLLKKYTVSFDTDGGKPIPEKQEVEKGTKWVEIRDRIPDPEKEGFDFNGWLVDDNRIVRRLIFDPRGGSPTPRQLTVYDNTEWREIKDFVTSPKKDGYNFKGWYLNEKRYTIDFNANGGHPTQEPLTVPKDSLWRDIKDQVVTPLKDGYNLKGWLVADRYSITFNANGGYPTPEPLTVADGTQWGEVKDKVPDPKKKGFALKGWREETEYTVSFDSRGGSPTQESLTVEVGTRWGDIKNQIQSPIREGFDFDGWMLKGPFTVSFNTNGGNNDLYPIDVEKGTRWLQIKDHVPTPTREGFEFEAWTVPDERAIFTIDFNTENQKPVTVYDGTTWGEIKDLIEKPVKKGYRFLGWSVE